MFLSPSDTSCALAPTAAFQSLSWRCQDSELLLESRIHLSRGEKLLQELPPGMGHGEGVLPCPSQQENQILHSEGHSHRGCQHLHPLAGVVWDEKGKSRLFLSGRGWGMLGAAEQPWAGAGPGSGLAVIAAAAAQVGAVNHRAGAAQPAEPARPWLRVQGLSREMLLPPEAALHHSPSCRCCPSWSQGCRAVCSQSSWWLCSLFVFVGGFVLSGFQFGFFPRVSLAFRALLQLKMGSPEQVCFVPGVAGLAWMQCWGCLSSPLQPWHLLSLPGVWQTPALGHRARLAAALASG